MAQLREPLPLPEELLRLLIVEQAHPAVTTPAPPTAADPRHTGGLIVGNTGPSWGDGKTAHQRVTEALLRLGKTGKKNLWQCPAHDDRDPSLHVTKKPGRVVIHCFAHCTPESILAALSLHPGDLFDDAEQDCPFPPILNDQTVITGESSAQDAAELATYSDIELDALEIPPLRWIIPGIVPEGLTILVGAPKAGKSSFILGCAFGLASGNQVLGSIKCESCDVLALFLEDNKRRVQERIRKLRAGRPPVHGLRYVTMSENFPRLDMGGIRMLERHLDAHPKTRLVIIDTWAKCKPRPTRKQELYDADTAAWSLLHSVASARRIAIIVLHHTRKALSIDGDWIQEISGSTGVTGVADTLLMLKRKRGGTTGVLKVTGREHDEDAELMLVGDPTTKGWIVTTERPEDQQAVGKQRDIVRVLEAQGRMWPREVEQACGFTGVRAFLQRMIEKKIVLRDSSDKYYVNPSYASYGVTAATPVTELRDNDNRF